MNTIEQRLKAVSEREKPRIKGRFPSLECEELDRALDHKFDIWEGAVRKLLDSSDPFIGKVRALKTSKEQLARGSASVEEIEEDLVCYSELDDELDTDIWMERCDGKTDKVRLKVRSDLIGEWSDCLERAIDQWLSDEIEKYRQIMMGSLEEWLRLIQSIMESTGSEGADMLWDLSLANLCRQDINTLREWADALSKDKKVREICDLLGRMISFDRSAEREESERDMENVYDNMVPDSSSKDEIVGLELGNWIEDAMPSELGLMTDPTLSTLFDLKFVEKRLLCFSKEGYVMDEEKRVEKVPVEETHAHKGPIIFCVDTSGSMQGTPEYVAKAVALYISMKAVKEGRSCYLINFGVDIETMDVTPPMGVPELLDFMRGSFMGGTDVRPALEKAIEMTGTERYSLADIIVISDFIVPESSFSVMGERIAETKRNGCRYHSLMIGDFDYSPEAMCEMFDYSWQYDTYSGEIRNVHRMGEFLAGK